VAAASEKTFPQRLRAMLDGGHAECGWLPEGDKFWICNPQALANNVVPQYFDHSSYASLTRALNAYSFHKMSPSTWAHPCFHRDTDEKQPLIVRKPQPMRIRGKVLKEQQDLEVARQVTGFQPSGPAPAQAVASPLALQLQKERIEAAIAQKEVARLEAKLREAQEQAKFDEEFLQKAVDEAAQAVALRMSSLVDLHDKMDVSDVRPEDFGLQAEDLGSPEDNPQSWIPVVHRLGEEGSASPSSSDATTSTSVPPSPSDPDEDWAGEDWDSISAAFADIAREAEAQGDTTPSEAEVAAMLEGCRESLEHAKLNGEWLPYQCPVACRLDAELICAKHCAKTRGQQEVQAVLCCMQAMAQRRLAASSPPDQPTQ